VEVVDIVVECPKYSSAVVAFAPSPNWISDISSGQISGEEMPAIADILSYISCSDSWRRRYGRMLFMKYPCLAGTVRGLPTHFHSLQALRQRHLRLEWTMPAC
jgi:hypothetical protein